LGPGYGGGYYLNITLADGTRTTFEFSGEGSGGHSYTNYCIFSPDSVLMDDVQKTMCDSMTYRTTTWEACPTIPTVNATAAIIKACNEGTFTTTVTGGKALSFTKRVTRCGIEILPGTFNCIQEKVNVEATQATIDDIIQRLKVTP
jgi:pectin methylesterase-like acyl-CoA thioesterase